MFSSVRHGLVKNGQRAISTKLCPKPVPVRLRHSPRKAKNLFSSTSCQTQFITSNNARWTSTATQSTSASFKQNESSVSLDTGLYTLELPYLWLRDHCRCDKCYNHSTNQKNILAQDLDHNIKPSDLTLNNDSLTLTWPDGHVSTFPFSWLKINAYPGPATEKVEKYLWDSTTLQPDDVPRVEFERFLEKDEGLKELLHSLLKYGIGLVTGVPADINGTERAAERVCFVQSTMFGGMWSFTADAARGDTAYTNIALGAHNDMTYYSIPAGIQVFHCVHHDGDGGQTLLVDGFKAAEDLRASDPTAFDTLSRVRLQHENAESGHHVRSLDPVIKVHPVTGAMEVIRYNQYDRAPMTTVPPAEQPAVYHAISALGRILQRQEGEMWIKLWPGMVLFVDNWRVMHGRSSFTGNRRVAGCYLPRDDWVGKARIMGLVWS